MNAIMKPFDASRSSSRSRRNAAITLALLTLGYAGYYLCRSNLSVAQPSIMKDLVAAGLSANQAKREMGLIVSLGTLAYAIGKFVGGGLGDSLGGRRVFLIGMAGAVAATVAFPLGGSIAVYRSAWVANRLVQSIGWLGLVKVCGRWFPENRRGRVMAFASLSFLFGDSIARRFMGALIEHHFTWRHVFFAAAAVLFVLFLINYMFLHESPLDTGDVEPSGGVDSVFGAAGDAADPAPLGSLLGPLLSSPGFLLVCLVSFGYTLLRETFNSWTPTYFVEAIGLSQADAANKSALFPLFGGVSVLLAGYLADRVGRAGRASILFAGLVCGGALLLALGRIDFHGSKTAPVALVALVGFTLIGPYSYMAGAIALDFGGKRGAATASGLIDGFGYLGGILAGETVARILVGRGWNGAFQTLAAVAWFSAIAAAVLVAVELARTRRDLPLEAAVADETT